MGLHNNPRYDYMLVKTKCVVCGKEYRANKYRLARGSAKYCSQKCHGKDVADHEIRKCLTCGKEFKAIRHKIESGDAKYCSRTCSAIANRNRLKEVCETCGKEFEIRVCEKGVKKYCCAKCGITGRIPKVSGEKHFAWKGGTRNNKRLIRDSREYENWRTEVFKRDDFTCRVCGIKGGKLHAHHIIRFSKILEDMKYNLPLFPEVEAAKIYTPFWDITNGITMCEKCHRNHHKKGNK